MEYKTIIDGNGNIVDLCVNFTNGLAQDFTMEEGHRAVERYSENFIKPFWNNSKWIESATDEEIKEWQEKNNSTLKEPSETEILQKQLLETQAIVATLQEQILLNGGIK